MADVEAQQLPVAGDVDFSLKKKKKKSSSKVTDAAGDSPAPQEDEIMADLGKKKKKKSKSATEDADVAVGDDGEAAAFEFKKKKKKSKSAATDFDAALKEAGVSAEDKAAAAAAADAAASGEQLAVNERGERDFSYNELLTKFFQVLRDNNPDLASDRSGVKYKIPPPQMVRDGKKSIFANIKEISDRMHRPTEHVIQFLFAELGTSGSVDGSQRLVIKGRYMQKQLETVLRKYITEYVSCKTCKSINTKLSKENRLYFLECNSCGSRRSVASIKTGYQAIIRRPR